ncbi:MAG: phosphoribosyl-ATP diphosphatase [Treponema sp.]|nr:phosphoribosyl-ATP diphosphatase [Treponema sp.]
MVIASIDIQNGKVVQLRQGSELMLERDNAGELAQAFDRCGEVAVIDLDAAMGLRPNTTMITPLLRKAECRVGGGIRTPQQAKELVSLGAKKVIIGSSVFRNPDKKGAGAEGGEFGVNVSLLKAFAQAIGRERLVVAVDARGGEIVIDGWKKATGLDLVQASRLAEPWASELLFTCVEREGTMTGIDMTAVKTLREAVSSEITVAGGVSSLAEIEEISALGCNVQLGMALYTGSVTLEDAFVRSLNWAKGEAGGCGGHDRPLLPLIAQSRDGQVLMSGFASREALHETFKRGKLCFHSRTRQKLWMKGETSGNVLTLVRLRADCDRDAILATVEPSGPVCHTGAWSCFSTSRRYTLEYLQSVIAGRFRDPVPGSYTATLDDKLVREKLMEEAEELCAAKTHSETVWEAADVLYFTAALMTRAGVSFEEVLAELERRHLK